jgi:hypothetical protein
LDGYRVGDGKRVGLNANVDKIENGGRLLLIGFRGSGAVDLSS